MTSHSLRVTSLLLATFALAACSNPTPFDGGAPSDAASDTPAPVDSAAPADAAADVVSPTDVARPDVAAPDAVVPDVVAPDVVVPADVAAPDARPDAVSPADVVVPDATAADAVAPDAVSADATAADSSGADAAAGDGAVGPFTMAHPLQADLRSLFTADSVANTASGGTSFPPLVPVDGSGYVLLTYSLGATVSDGDSGLPDNGFFAANAQHPDVQLAFSNASTAPNCLILNDPATSLLTATFAVPATQYSALQVYLTSTEGSSAATLTLHYSDGTSAPTSFSVPDWFQSFSASAPVFVLQDSLSRYSSSGGDDYSSGAALYGVSVVANPAKTLTSVTLDTTGHGRIVLFGATAY